MNAVDTTERPLLELARHRGYWRWAAATMLLRLPPIMAPMALVLVSMDYNGSPALGGLLVGVTLVPAVVGAPIAGRMLDRWGTEKWTPRLLWLGAAGRLALAGAFLMHAPVLVLAAICLITAMITCGISGATRALLNVTVPKRLIGPALSVDSTLVEVVVISAPFVVAVTALAGSLTTLVAMAAATAVGGVLIRTRRTAEPRTEQVVPGTAPAEGVQSVWRNPLFLFWVLVNLAFGHLLGTAEVGALPRVTQDGGGAAEAAILIGVLGLASALAGLVFAWFANRIKAGFVSQAAVLLALMIASNLLMANAGSWIWLLLAFLAIGLWTAPLNSVMNEAPGYIVPERRLTESFNIIAAAQNLGFAIAGGLLAIVPVEAMLLLGSVTAVLALVSMPVLTRRGAAVPAVQVGTS